MRSGNVAEAQGQVGGPVPRVNGRQVRGPHGYRSSVSPDIVPGETLAVTVSLRRPGRYTLICVKPGHAKLGMKAVISVR